MYSSVAFCLHCCAMINTPEFQNLFNTTNSNSVPVKQWLHPSLQPVVPSHLLSVCVTWPPLYISYKWNHAVFATLFLALASFSCYTIFKIHLCCSIYLKFTPFFWVTIHLVIFSCTGSSLLWRLLHCSGFLVVSGGYYLVAVWGLLIVAAFPVAEHWLSGIQASVVAALRL